MMNSFPFGQYIPGISLVHSLDPRTKLFFVVIMMAAIFAVNTLPGVLITALFTGIFIALTRVPLTIYFRGMRPLMVLVGITAAFQVFLIPGEVIWRWWVFSITDTGIEMGALMSYRLIMVFVLAQLLTLTTSPLQLTDGLEMVLGPLTRVGFPAHELAMIMTIALRFIPVFFEEGSKIILAQVSRGADFQGSWLKSARNLVAIMVPLFAQAFRRADDLALAMESRCYTGGEGRTQLHEITMSRTDYLVMAATAALVPFIFVLRT
ncbi:MAG: energy-coupling factor transporter transmembrane protein EcfT [Syntrophomonadaceae bacterium]|nr:energy-coupling factor transporter transmembrane protein EcfT [Syntrophomonadaceae bacterium]